MFSLFTIENEWWNEILILKLNYIKAIGSAQECESFVFVVNVFGIVSETKPYAS